MYCTSKPSRVNCLWGLMAILTIRSPLGPPLFACVALAVHVDGLAHVDTGGDGDRDGLAAPDEPLAIADLAGVMVAPGRCSGTFLLGGHHAERSALLGGDGAGAVAVRAGVLLLVGASVPLHSLHCSMRSIGMSLLHESCLLKGSG